MKNFILAARPRTLIVGLVPPMICFAYAQSLGSEVPLYLLFCTVTASLFIQIATNFFNDLIDHQKGSDLVRLGPQRVTASGLVTEKQIRFWAYGSVVAAFLVSIPLVLRGGPVILALGLVSLYLSYGYTGGSISLAYRGLGELFVFLFFGLFSFLGSQYLFTQKIDFLGFVIASQLGLLAVSFIGINNLRDRHLDKKVNKLTLATRMNSSLYRLLVVITILAPYTLCMVTTHGQGFSYLGLLIGIPFSVFVFKKEGSELNTGLKLAGIHLIIFTILTILDLKNGNIF